MNELDDTPKHSDLIYDVGMHKGEDTWFYLQKGFRVIGFEADPALAQHCRERFQEFIREGRLTVIEGAIVSPGSVEAGLQKVRFYQNDKISVWGTIDANWAERNINLGASSHVIEVDVIDFVNVIQRHGVPHYMKIDIEGLDMVCVNALKLFRERPDFLSIESDKTSFANIKGEIDALVDLGYDSFQAVEQSAIFRSQSPPYPAREGCYIDQRFEHGSSGLFGSELGDEWRSQREILHQYRLVRLGYYLVGDDGILKRWRFPGAWMFRSLIGRVLGLFTRASVPGWYDTHARHSCVDTIKR